MIQLIKKGGLRERANRSRKYQGSENTETTLLPNSYQQSIKENQNRILTQYNEHSTIKEKSSK